MIGFISRPNRPGVAVGDAVTVEVAVRDGVIVNCGFGDLVADGAVSDVLDGVIDIVCDGVTVDWNVGVLKRVRVGGIGDAVCVTDAVADAVNVGIAVAVMLAVAVRVLVNSTFRVGKIKYVSVGKPVGMRVNAGRRVGMGERTAYAVSVRSIPAHWVWMTANVGSSN